METNSEIGMSLFLMLCGILGMLLMGITVIAFFLVYQKKLFTQRENIQNLEKEHQIHLLEYSIESQEAERKRIAYDLHDDLGSLLSTIRIYIHQLTQELPSQNYVEIKKESHKMIDSAIDQIRNISHGLYPPNLEHVGLIQACEDLCKHIRKMDGLDVDFSYEEVPEFTKKEELSFYRILQELTKNSIKHAKASNISVVFNSSADDFELIYSDNGIGFEYEKFKNKAQGMGLKSIESRANSIRAISKFNSEPGKGFMYKLLLKNKS